MPYNIERLASLTAQRAREKNVRPNAVVRMICRENKIPALEIEGVTTLVLSACGRRGGAARRKKATMGRYSPEMIESARQSELALIAGIPEDDL